ncbi:MAG: dockerin type I repeat-containing protein [Methanosarcinales archaeon]|nr:dockerin type I repeat-containing protein [Methanosarcinales archaeon]
MTNLTTWNRTAEAYIFSPEDFSVYTHFNCYVCEDPPDASIVWIDPDGDAYHTTNFHNMEDGYQHWRSNIYVKGHYPEDHPGEWQAYVYINGELIAIKRFWIGTPTPSGSNSPPVAKIGDNQTIYIGDTFVTDGHRSCDSDGNIMFYNWSRKRSYWSGWRNWSNIRDVWYTTDWSPVFEPFSYDFVLTATDDDGAIDTARKQVIIEPTAWDLADDDSDGIPNVLDRNPDEPDRHISWNVGEYAVYDVIEADVVVGSHTKTIMPPVLINNYTFCVLRHSGHYNVTSYLALDGWCYKETVNNRTYFYVAADREDILWNYTETGPVNITTPAGTFECYVVDVKGCRDECLIHHNTYWQPTPWDCVEWNIKIVSYNVSTGVPIRTWILTDYSGKPVHGDLNSDTQITTADAVIALDIAVGSRPCDNAMLAVADVNNDGQVTSLDALIILQTSAVAATL